MTNKFKELSSPPIIMLIAFLVGFLSLRIVPIMEQRRQEKALQKVKEEFVINRKKIIDDIKKEISVKNYELALQKSNKYLLSQDKELMELNSKASKENEIQKLIADSKQELTQDTKTNLRIYKKLSKIYPTNKIYKQKVQFYIKRKNFIESLFNKDGTFPFLEDDLREEFINENSDERGRLFSFEIEHISTSYHDKGDDLIIEGIYKIKQLTGAGTFYYTYLAEKGVDLRNSKKGSITEEYFIIYEKDFDVK
ncbi:hypothetical protein [Synechocystis sp. PCC 7338]|uniref:hypothetical protein n=1 Tax=Synechocystis sp. PCC 7338 TaxID=2732530 RepID=UPI001BAE9DAB|nr:hypothetical protein [Synechocystis sp. PCC 7338]QUS61623.1 hypothetical protein HTZ78_13790 [Synechocystis sp. PCC 7338]